MATFATMMAFSSDTSLAACFIDYLTPLLHHVMYRETIPMSKPPRTMSSVQAEGTVQPHSTHTFYFKLFNPPTRFITFQQLCRTLDTVSQSGFHNIKF